MESSKSILLSCALLLTAGAAQSAEVVAVVSAKSAVTAMTKDQVADVFLGKTTKFPDGAQAVPIDQAPSSQLREEFYTKVTGRTAAQLKSYWAKQSFSGKGTAPKAVAGDEEVRKLIAANPNLIGYMDKAQIDASVRTVFAP
jgi:ABC-type phosphate transport system substrate-binding protein